MKPAEHPSHASALSGPAWPLDLAGSSAAARRVRERIRELARGVRPVLVVAPNGCDASGAAGMFHVLACRDAPLIVADCADGPDVERAVFGHAAARNGRHVPVETVSADAGLLQACGGVLVLHSVHELPASAQARLSRVLRDGEVRLSAGMRRVSLSVRVVASTHVALEREVQHGAFRPDLLKRFANRQVELVPLRDRREDIGPLAVALMARAARGHQRAPREFTRAALALLAALPWPGDVAELARVVHALASAPAGDPVHVEDVLAQVDPGALLSAGPPRTTLREARRQFERDYIAAVLKQSGWRMGPAARVLGIQRTNLYRKARQLGIARAKAGE